MEVEAKESAATIDELRDRALNAKDRRVDHLLFFLLMS